MIGEEGKGLRYILDGMNAERILIAAECVGDGRFFIDRATGRANERVVFDRPIGQNQGVQFPIARAYANVEAADLMVRRAAALFDRNEGCGAEANMAKLLAADASWAAANGAGATFGGHGGSGGCGAGANMAKLLAADASWEAANVAVQTFGGYGVDAEYDVERKFRETRLYQVAPISTNLILSYLAQHVLGLPRSF